VRGFTRCKGVQKQIAIQLSHPTISLITDRRITIVFVLKMPFGLLVVTSLSHYTNVNSNARSWAVKVPFQA
jgi:hypothetical protein